MDTFLYASIILDSLNAKISLVDLYGKVSTNSLKREVLFIIVFLNLK